ncbi:HET-domain-containing protein, partial [Byssothecium circinans]
PVFEALSYTWANLDGDATLSARVFVGDEYIPLPVTKNCVSALHQFRTTKDRVLWVDAICINQMDIEERSLQVQIMQSIYSSAARVLVYVGDGTPETDRAMQAIGSARPPEHARSEARQLLSRPYFYRLWVVQEVKAAMRTTITCGDYTTTWDDLLTFADHINKEDGGLLEWVTGNFSSLLTGLRITRYCLCSDPRDKVFAISGLLSPTRNEIRLIQVNYAISVQDLFTSLAISWIMTKQFEFLLNLTRFKQVVHLPSWVPDWTV